MDEVAIDADAQSAYDQLVGIVAELGSPAARAGEGNIAHYRREAERALATLRQHLSRVERDRYQLRAALDAVSHPYHVIDAEPLLHTGITDMLAEDHPLAYECVSCKVCGRMVHASNNECMDAWVETGQGNYCLDDFAAAYDQVAHDEDLALKR